MRRTPYRDETDTSSVKRHVTTGLFEKEVTTERKLKEGFVSVIVRSRIGIKPLNRRIPHVINKTNTRIERFVWKTHLSVKILYLQYHLICIVSCTSEVKINYNV